MKYILKESELRETIEGIVKEELSRLDEDKKKGLLKRLLELLGNAAATGVESIINPALGAGNLLKRMITKSGLLKSRG